MVRARVSDRSPVDPGAEDLPDDFEGFEGDTGLPAPDLPDWDEQFGTTQRFSPGVVMGGLALVALALVLVFVLLSGGGDDAEDDTGEGDQAVVPPTAPVTVPLEGGPTTTDGSDGEPTTAGEATPPSTAIPGHMPPRPVPALVTVADDFEGADDASSLGETNGGQRWDAVLGTWGTTGGKAGVTETNAAAGPRNIAVVEDVAVTQGSVSVELDPVTQGAGLVFRYRSPFNYFVLSANPDLRRWHLSRVVEGVVEPVGVVKNAPVEGRVLATVQLRGLWIYVYLNDEPVLAVRDEQLATLGGVGMYATTGAANQAIFGGFIAGTAVEDAGDGSVGGAGNAPSPSAP